MFIVGCSEDLRRFELKGLVAPALCTRPLWTGVTGLVEAAGHKDQWTFRHLDIWTDGHVDIWTNGHMYSGISAHYVVGSGKCCVRGFKCKV